MLHLLLPTWLISIVDFTDTWMPDHSGSWIRIIEVTEVVIRSNRYFVRVVTNSFGSSIILGSVSDLLLFDEVTSLFYCLRFWTHCIRCLVRMHHIIDHLKVPHSYWRTIFIALSLGSYLALLHLQLSLRGCHSGHVQVFNRRYYVSTALPINIWIRGLAPHIGLCNLCSRSWGE